MHEKVNSELSEILTLLKATGVRHSAMAEELALLRSENEDLKQSKEDLNRKIGEMEELIFILKSSVAPLDDESKKEFEKRLNKYILTINKCIGLLKT